MQEKSQQTLIETLNLETPMIVQQLLPSELFKGKTVFVTGGGSGINLGVASNFAALGAHVAICGRTQEKLDAARRCDCAAQ